MPYIEISDFEMRATCMSTQANKDIQHIGRKSMIHEDRVRQMIGWRFMMKIKHGREEAGAVFQKRLSGIGDDQKLLLRNDGICHYRDIRGGLSVG